jgi:hypothetical protein
MSATLYSVSFLVIAAMVMIKSDTDDKGDDKSGDGKLLLLVEQRWARQGKAGYSGEHRR